jgi:hypothetical protein
MSVIKFDSGRIEKVVRCIPAVGERHLSYRHEC